MRRNNLIERIGRPGLITLFTKFTAMWSLSHHVHTLKGQPRKMVVSQCPKLRVHPAPGAHISTAGCMIFGGVHPVCARFLSCLLLLYIGGVHVEISGCTVLGKVHPMSAHYKSLISDTVSGGPPYQLRPFLHFFLHPPPPPTNSFCIIPGRNYKVSTQI